MTIQRRKRSGRYGLRRARCRVTGALAVAATLVSVTTDCLAAGRGTKHFNRDRVDPGIREVMERPRYQFARWGLLVEDLRTGQVVQQLNADEFFLPASSTKMFTVAVALDMLGDDHRFVTPIHRSGNVDAEGVLAGDLILVGAGDLTLGGRDKPDGTIAIADFDHVDANAIEGAELTEPDPLGGLDRLAEQVASAGITRVSGDVIVDDRLFETAETRPEVVVSPIIVNDNFIDIVIAPTQPGQRAKVDWRPKSAAFDVDADVETVAAGVKTDIEADIKISGEVTDGLLTVRGQIASNKAPLVQVHPVRGPARFASTLLIEALARAGVPVEAPVLADNAVDLLPSEADVAALPRVATLESAPFSEYAKLILKVSHNLGAELMAAVIAAENGERTVDEGLQRIGEMLPRLGVEPNTFAFNSASGRDGNRTTPRAAATCCATCTSTATSR